MTTFSILFYLRTEKVAPSGEVPIYCRVTVDGQRAEISIKRKTHPGRWDSAKGMVKGRNEDSRTLNSYIEEVRRKLYEHHKALLQSGKLITALAIKNAFYGFDQRQHTVLKLSKYHNIQMQAQLGNGFAQGTYKNYVTTHKVLADFIRFQYKTDDVSLNQLNYQFVADFDLYLRTQRSCHNNGAAKHLQRLKKLIHLAIASDWLDKDPFIRYKITIDRPDPRFLTAEELLAIETKEFQIERLNEVRDIFIFSCYTGLAYADIAKLTPQNITFGIDKEKWINVYREKTNNVSRVPLLPKALGLLEKYREHPLCKVTRKSFPVKSNQRMNSYLKEIGDLCGISKHLTYHVARHTFATTVTLTNGVPKETVAYMLGQVDPRSIRVYAQIVPEKVSRDMQTLKSKLQNQ